MVNVTAQKTGRILIVGSGQIGSRHMQAASALDSVHTIEVVDPRPESLALGRDRVNEIPDRNRKIKYRWMTRLEEVAPDGDLCVVATQSKGRCELIKEIHEKLGFKLFLIEKIVCQSVEEYVDLMEYIKKNNLKIWVNFKSRLHPSHRHVKKNLISGEPILLSHSGGNQGLATIGCHGADLFSFYSGEKEIFPTGSFVHPQLHPSKRGSDLYDLSGTLLGSTKNGSQLTISFAANHKGPPVYILYTKSYRAIIDDTTQWLRESHEKSGWKWEEVPFEATMTISHMSRTIISDILSKESCDLPTLEDGFTSHKFIFSQLKPHFSNLLKKEVKLCPVT